MKRFINSGKFSLPTDIVSTVQRPRDGYNSFIDGSTTQPPFNSFLNSKWNDPYFDTSISNNVTALVGKSAYLSCRVRNLGNKTVSIWLRTTNHYYNNRDF